MGNGLRLRVVMAEGDGGEFSVSPKVQVMFEREFRTGIGKALSTEQKVEHLYWLAWKAMHASGRVVKPFDGWLEDIVDVQIVDDKPVPFDETV